VRRSEAMRASISARIRVGGGRVIRDGLGAENK
jgi:hypothetical protein